MRIEAKDLIAWLRDCALEPYSYSGRAMYGARCVGVTVEAKQMLAFGAMLAREATYATDEDDLDLDEVVDLMQRARDDNMGRDIVVYWPDLAWPDDEKEDADGDDED